MVRFAIKCNSTNNYELKSAPKAQISARDLRESSNVGANVRYPHIIFVRIYRLFFFNNSFLLFDLKDLLLQHQSSS